MSEENVGAVRQPVALRGRTRRRIDERIGLRFPRLTAFLARAVSRISPRSRLRRAAVRRYVRMGFEAISRGDHEAGLILYHPEVVSSFPAEFLTVGTQTETRGREARLRFQQQWYAEWGGWQVEPEEVIDLGDRVLVLASITGTGLRSGAAVNTQAAWLITIPDGQATKEVIFFDHGQALEAAGLSE